MIIVGLTGGIASGKSTVANYLKKIKIPIHESDKIVRALYKKPTNKFLLYLEKEGFKESVFKKKINKAKIREIIFSNDKKRRKIEIFIHHLVKLESNKFIKKNKSKKIIFLDIPILLENNLQSICNYVCTTWSPLKKRKHRAIKRKGMTVEIFNKIVKKQINDKIRKRNSDYIIKTDTTKTKTYLQVKNIIYDVLNKDKNIT